MRIWKMIAVWSLFALGIVLSISRQYNFAIISFLASEALAFLHDNK